MEILLQSKSALAAGFHPHSAPRGEFAVSLRFLCGPTLVIY
jgi:hypothetical protein